MKACNGRKRRKTYGAEVQALQEEVSILKRELAYARVGRELEEGEIQPSMINELNDIKE